MSWLITEDRDQVRWLTIDRPERKNAIPMDGWPVLRDAFMEFEESPLRVLVLTGSGGDFCAGADLDQQRIEEFQSVADRHRRLKLVGSVAMALHRLSKPTVAAVDGVAVGAGLNLALGCDIVVATERARFSEIFVRRGLALDSGGSWLLPRIVGLQRAKEMSLTGRMVDAAEAARIGLVTDVVAADQLEATVSELTERILQGAPLAQMLSKQMLNGSFGSSLADALAWEGEAQTVMQGTEDFREGLLSFLEKRDPEWRGR
jgi:2-(1,2-epoxy-1,2-dihydrophenyl)acetyl-CoA isomerase